MAGRKKPLIVGRLQRCALVVADAVEQLAEELRSSSTANIPLCCSCRPPVGVLDVPVGDSPTIGADDHIRVRLLFSGTAALASMARQQLAPIWVASG